MPTTQTAPGDNILRLTRDEALRLALENNPDLAASRYDPAISDERVNAAKAAYVPTLQSGLQPNSQLQPATSLFFGTSGLETGTWSANASVVQLMPWGATIRYVEANPLAANLVRRARDWRGSSLWMRMRGGDEDFLTPCLADYVDATTARA